MQEHIKWWEEACKSQAVEHNARLLNTVAERDAKQLSLTASESSLSDARGTLETILLRKEVLKSKSVAHSIKQEVEHSAAMQKCAAERDDAKLALKDSASALVKEKLLSETSLQRFKLAMIKRLSTKTWKRSTVKWMVAAFAGNMLLSSFVLSKVSTHLPEKTLTRLRAAFNWVTALALRRGTALSHVLLGLVVSILIRIQTAVAPSALFIHTNHMIVRRQPDVKSSAILVDGGGTDFMTNTV